MTHPTKKRLLDAGWAMLVEHGYNHLGVQALLTATATPKGSFYHHFKDKEDFAVQVVEQYMRQVHAALDVCLADSSRAPLERVRRFFELTQQSYRKEGYRGLSVGRTRTGTVGYQRSVPARDRRVLFRNRPTHRRLPRRGTGKRRHSRRFRPAAPGESAG